MKRRDFLFQFGAVAALATVPTAFVWGDSSKKKIVYFDFSNGFVHPPTVDEPDGTSFCAKNVKKMGERLGFDVVCTKDCSVFDGDLSDVAAFVFYTCGDLDKEIDGKQAISQQGVRNFYDAIRSGAGFVGIHSATDTWKTPGSPFENQDEKDRNEYTKMIGANFIIHGSQQETTLTLTEPIQLPSLKALGTKSTRFFDEWYCLKNFNKDIHVVLVQETDGMQKDGGNACYDRPKFPSTWIRNEGKGRVAYTSLGHGNEMVEKELFQGLLFDLISFAVGKIDLDTTPNLDDVCPGAFTLKNK